MAKKQQQQQRVNKLINGMNRDVNPIDQPAGSYRFALNAVNNREVAAISNEHGNIGKVTFDPDYELIGSIVVNDAVSDTKFIIFLVDESTAGIIDSEIGKVAFDDTYTTLINDSTSIEKFNLSTRFPIEGEYKINATGEVSIYWTDDNNVPRYLNLSNIPVSPYTVDSFDLFPKIKAYPQISLDAIKNNGGALRSGAYQLSVAYMTEDGAITSYLDVSNPVYINEESEGQAQAPANSWGGNNLPSTDYNGCDGGTHTSKSILWDVKNLDTTYKYIVPCIVRTIDQVKDAVTIKRIVIPPNASSIKVFYSGVEEATEELLGAVQIPKESYTKAKTVAQVDDVLYWGNLEKQKIDIGYQKFANSITIHRVELNNEFDATKTLNISGLGSIDINFTRSFGVDGYDSCNFKGYKRGEVYAFYITFVLKDGSETVAYHIPGREPTELDWRDGPGGTRIWEDGIVDNSTEKSGNPHPIVSQLPYLGGTLRILNFHMGNNYAHTQGMYLGYWENENETYPSLADDPNGNFETWIVDGGGNPLQTGVLHDKKVRHHHFPLAMYQHNNFPGYLEFGDIHAMANTSTLYVDENIHAMNPQGIRVNNIPIPKFVVDTCIAYKVYYLHKDSEDKVCVARSQLQGGRENAQKHFDIHGDSWLCFPWQFLSTYDTYGGIDTPFFVAEPYDLMQSGESIQGIDYIATTAYNDVIRNKQVTGDPDIWTQGFTIWATDSSGQSFDRGYETHLSFDWTGCDPDDNGSWTYRQVKYRALQGKTRMPSGSIIDSVSGFSRAVDNEGATETIAFEMYDNLTWYNNARDVIANWMMYGNAGTGQCPNQLACAQHYWPTSNTAGQNNRCHTIKMRRRVANFMSLREDVHFGFQNQRDFVYTGYSNVVDPAIAISPGGGYTSRGNRTLISSVPPSPFPQIQRVTVALGKGPITMGGDTHIGYYSTAKYRVSDRYMLDPGNGGSWPYHILGGGAYNSRDYAWYHNSAYSTSTSKHHKDYAVHVYITESKHNPNLKHANTDDDAFYAAYDVNSAALMDHSNPSIGFGLYNLDYNTPNNIRLLRAFDPDDILQVFTDYPTRIIRSVKYNQSGLEDNFRVYLPEDFRDLPRHRGELWKVKGYNNVILPHMERSLYLTKGKETLKMTEASEAYLGTGDLFEKDPAEALQTDRGHGGTGSQWASITSEFGYFFVDRDAGKVFLMGEKLEEISMYGMRKFFLDKLDTGIQLQSWGLPNNFDNPIKGIGIHATYDPALKRFILTKKDLRPTADLPATTVYDKEKKWFYDVSGYPVPMSVTSGGTTTYYFEEYVEWTVSYDPTLKIWVSFHTYQPNHYVSDLTIFYSYPGLITSNVSKLYEHGNKNTVHFPGKFYNKSFPWFIDCITNESPDLTKQYSSIDYTGEVTKWSTGGIMADANLFTMIEVHNSYQASPPQLTNVTGRRTERVWFFNGFRDMADIVSNNPTTAHPMIHNSGYAQPGMIGILSPPGQQTKKFMPSLNSNFIDTTKTWDQKRKFTDKWLGFRLYNNNSTNNFVSLYTVNTHKKISYR